ncbi:AbiTii domain-containing protein [Marixanthomonas ophiurae]|uniref:TIR domain-containing protein n=1 Tax=Marixanthomonas ophiurae TaxID=387659 RepID=A0A3E1Q8E9_9FLAO|nr:SEFIR domain-containing protein [Marixanthomonas ophiurae]RFN58406.1 TIR domain-containing protein [Marixanthomonas ophiurae]
MKELLKQLYSGEGRLSLLLLQAKEFAEQFDDEDLIRFIDKELNGYDAGELPEYRIIKAEIIGTIKNAYGQIVKKDVTINFSVLSKHVGIDLSDTHIPDGIGFIEDGLVELTGQLVQRSIPPGAVEMLNKTFKHNNPQFHLSSASHSFGKAALQFILTKVRQDLITKMQKLNKENEINMDEVADDIKSDVINVFVTYAWEDNEHNDKVISFVNFLRESGYNATMDRKESQEDTATDFNQMMITGISNSDKVIVVLSEKYKEKADNFIGGVGTEFRIIFEQLKTYTNKFVFVSFGKNPNEVIVPTAIGGRDILNLKKDQDETKFNQLFAKLNSENTIVFSEVNETRVEVKVQEIKPFKL